jgi:hypothetical protein
MRRLDQLEASTDEKFTVVFDAIRQLMAPPPEPKRRPIGFVHPKEKQRAQPLREQRRLKNTMPA